MKLLLNNGAKAEISDKLGRTPLFIAVRHGLEVVQLLVQHGAKLNVQNINGKTPLHMAIASEQYDVIMFLLSQDADVGLTDVLRNTTLHYVTGELLKVSRFAGYVRRNVAVIFRNPVIRNAVGLSGIQQNIYVAHGLLDYQFNHMMCVDCHGNTILHHAVGVYYDKLKMFNIGKTKNVSEAVDFLVKHGADINAQNNAGLTPLHVARRDEAIIA